MFTVCQNTENARAGREFKDWPFPSCLQALFQNEAKCEGFDMKIIFISHANKTHFKVALGLVLKVRVFGTRKWPVLA